MNNTKSNPIKNSVLKVKDIIEEPKIIKRKVKKLYHVYSKIIVTTLFIILILASISVIFRSFSI